MAAPKQLKRLQQISRAGLILVAIALVLTLVGGWLASTRGVAAIDQTKLENYQEALHSYAAEGLLLAQQYQAKRSTANYTEVSFNKLFDAVSDVSNKLQIEQPEANLDKAVKDTAGQASDLADILSQLSELPGQGQLSSLVSQLRDTKQQLEKDISGQ
jgi:hypothetical protein